MSEHRSRSAKVIPLPIAEDEEGWPPELLEKLSERLWLLSEFLEDHEEVVDMYALTRTQQEIFELMRLYFCGLAPSKARAAVDGVVPKWQRFNELVESNRCKAQALLRRRAS